MESSPRRPENQYPASSSTTSSGSNSNGLRQPSPPQPQPQPLTPVPITRSEPNNPYPTTFVQADSSSFKQVVQMLTGSSETAKIAAFPASRPDSTKNTIPPVKTAGPRKPASKLYERRNSNLKNFKISPLVPGLVNCSGYSSSPRPGTPDILSPSLLDFPSLVLSPVTPLIPDPFNRSPPNGVGAKLDMEAEDKAIAKKGFYMHPSPANTPRDSEPRLLPLFPVTSPKVSGANSSS